MTQTIALISPASPVSRAEIAQPKRYLEECGYRVVESESLYDQQRFLAGSDGARAAEFMWAWCDDEIDAIIAVRGGYGSQRILPLLDWGRIAQHEKPLFGFSDITALQLALLAKAGKGSYSGFLLTGAEGHNTGALYDILHGVMEPPSYLGGCLSLVYSLLGSEYLPDFTGANLLLEDVGEKPYCVDRMLSSLELAGCFEGVASVTFGSFKNCISTDAADGTIEDVLDEWRERLSCLVIMRPSYGHGAGEIIRCQF